VSAGDTWARRRAAAVEAAALSAIADPTLSEPERHRAKLDLASADAPLPPPPTDAALAAIPRDQLATAGAVLKRLLGVAGVSRPCPAPDVRPAAVDPEPDALDD
jgi:hypothetical protein